MIISLLGGAVQGNQVKSLSVLEGMMRTYGGDRHVILRSGFARVRLSCLEEIEQWVLSWGPRATVLQPTELRERLFKTAEELWQRYGGPMVLHEA